MFQPMPTPYAAPYSSFGAYVANAHIPEYSFAPTPLGQSFEGSSSSSCGGHGHHNSHHSNDGGNASVHANNHHHHHLNHPGLSPIAADPVTSPLFHDLPPLTLRQHHDHHHHRLSPSSNKSAPSAASAAAHHHRLQNSRSRRQTARPSKNHRHYSRYHNHHIKMEPQSDVADQELAASKYQPNLEVSNKMRTTDYYPWLFFLLSSSLCHHILSRTYYPCWRLNSFPSYIFVHSDTRFALFGGFVSNMMARALSSARKSPVKR